MFLLRYLILSFVLHSGVVQLISFFLFSLGYLLGSKQEQTGPPRIIPDTFDVLRMSGLIVKLKSKITLTEHVSP